MQYFLRRAIPALLFFAVSSPALAAELANSTTLMAHSNNFAATNGPQKLWDSCFEGSAFTQNCTAGGSGISSFWLEFDLGAPYDLADARLFGDADGAWTSTSWTLRYRTDATAAWTTAFSGGNAFVNGWVAQNLAGLSGRFIRVEVSGGSGGTQARELSISGTPKAVAPSVTTTGSVEHKGTVTGTIGGISSNTIVTSSAVPSVVDNLYLAAITSRERAAVVSVTGLGMTWSRLAAQCSGAGQTMVEVWKAQGIPQQQSAVRATFDRNVTAGALAVTRYGEVDISIPTGTIAKGNSAGGGCAGGALASSYSVPITTAGPNRAVYAAVALSGRTHTAGSGYAEMYDFSSGGGTFIAGLAAEQGARPTVGSAPVTGFFSGATDYAVVAVEIRPINAKDLTPIPPGAPTPAPGGTTPAPSPNQTLTPPPPLPQPEPAPQPPPVPPVPSTAFANGDCITTIFNVNVYDTPNGRYLTFMRTGFTGVILGGPEFANGSWWWNVRFDDIAGTAGWITENGLRKIVCGSITPPPPPPPPLPPPPPPKFTIGNCVIVNMASIDVRDVVSSALLGTQPKGAKGKVSGGPIELSGVTGWMIDYDTGPDGWSPETGLDATDCPVPPPPPPPPPACAEASTTATVYADPDGTILGTQPAGTKAKGAAVTPPDVNAKYVNDVLWWKMDFETGADGWVRATEIKAVDCPPPPPADFTASQCVRTLFNANVYDGPNGRYLGFQSVGMQGRVLADKPQFMNGSWWWKVDFSTGLDGWVTENALGSCVSPPLPPPPPPAAVGLPTPEPPPAPSSVFAPGQCIAAAFNVNVYDGPNGRYLTFVLSGTSGKITGGPQFANGSFWWRVAFGDSAKTVGWVVENGIVKAECPPTPEPLPPPFGIGDCIETLVRLNVRESAGVGMRILGTQNIGARGQISGGPRESGGYRWWNVNYDILPDGWSADGAPDGSSSFMRKVECAEPTAQPEQERTLPEGPPTIEPRPEVLITNEGTVTSQVSNTKIISTSANVQGFNASGNLYIATFALGGQATVLMVEGLGLEWSRVRTQCNASGDTRIELWSAQGTPFGDGRVTAELSANVTSAAMSVSRYSGVSAQNPIGMTAATNARGGSCAGGGGASTYSLLLTTTGSNDVLFAAIAAPGETHSPGTGYAEHFEVLSGSGPTALTLAGEDGMLASPGTVPVTGSFNASADYAAIGVVIQRIGGLPPVSTRFSVGSVAQTTTNLVLRTTPSAKGTPFGLQPAGASGTVVAGPRFGEGLWWWNINFSSGPDGWAAENWLAPAGTIIAAPPPATPPSGSLANSSTMTANSANFSVDFPVDNLWDGCVAATPSCSAGNSAIPSFWVEFDIGLPQALSRARLFGDTDGAWTSRFWIVRYRMQLSDPWTTAFAENAFVNGWSERALSGVTARYLRVEVIGNAALTGTQAHELEIYGTGGQ